MTDRERVLEKWPDAVKGEAPFDAIIGRRVWIESKQAHGLISGWLNATEDEAWAEAAQRLTQ